MSFFVPPPFVKMGTSVFLDLKTGLVGYWNLDEANGQRNDSSGNGYHLTDNNTVGSNTGQGGAGAAAEFVAANAEYFSTSVNVPLEAPFEITCWAQLDADPGAEGALFEWSPMTGGGVPPFAVIIQTAGRLGLRFRDADNNSQAIGGTPASDMG